MSKICIVKNRPWTHKDMDEGKAISLLDRILSTEV